jgi:hypothetical protein
VYFFKEKFETWGEWSECSTSCGVGQRIRYIECLDIEHSKCDSKKREISECIENRVCNKTTQNWSEWSEWSPCNQINKEHNLCANGLKYRNRTCLSFYCIGASIERRNCKFNHSIEIKSYCLAQNQSLKLCIYIIYKLLIGFKI